MHVKEPNENFFSIQGLDVQFHSHLNINLLNVTSYVWERLLRLVKFI